MLDDGENFFKYMESTETVSFANIIETKCLWHCFSTISQNDLNSAKDNLNTDRIHNFRFQAIHGRPNVLYEIPSRNRRQECLKFTILNEIFDQTALQLHRKNTQKFIKNISAT